MAQATAGRSSSTAVPPPRRRCCCCWGRQGVQMRRRRWLTAAVRSGIAAAAFSRHRPPFPRFGKGRHFARLRQLAAARRGGGVRCLREMAPAGGVLGALRASPWWSRCRSCERRPGRGLAAFSSLTLTAAWCPNSAAPLRPARASLRSAGFHSSVFQT